jgi:hypothetical protein
VEKDRLKEELEKVREEAWAMNNRIRLAERAVSAKHEKNLTKKQLRRKQ